MNIKQILVVFALIIPTASQAAVDMFLDIDTVMGESQDNAHQGEIDVLAWSWGSSSNGRCTQIQDISITKFVDLSSPTLLMGQIMGTVYDTATLTVRKAGDSPLEYIILELRNVYVSSLSTGGSGGEDRLTENVTLNFETARYRYTPQNPDGSEGAAVEAEIFAGKGCK